MDVFIALANIKNFNALLLTVKGDSERRVLWELLGRETEKLAAAVAAQARLLPAVA